MAKPVACPKQPTNLKLPKEFLETAKQRGIKIVGKAPAAGGCIYLTMEVRGSSSKSGLFNPGKSVRQNCKAIFGS